MKRRGYQAAYGARSTNHNLTRWNEFIIDVDFQTICRDEGASSQRVLNICSTEIFVTCPKIWSRPCCDYTASTTSLTSNIWMTFKHSVWWLTYWSSISIISSGIFLRAERTAEFLNQHYRTHPAARLNQTLTDLKDPKSVSWKLNFKETRAIFIPLASSVYVPNAAAL